MVGGDPYPIVFKIRSIDQDVRSQIYEIAAKNETGYSRGDGHQEDLKDMQPSYGATPISNDTLTQNDPSVKEKNSLRDEDYMDAVNRGDMAAAQKMVDAAARSAGYTVKGYHGTDAEAFTVFDKSRIGEASGLSILGDGFYFSDKKSVAAQYGKNVYTVWLKQDKPYSATPCGMKRGRRLRSLFGRRTRNSRRTCSGCGSF